MNHDYRAKFLEFFRGKNHALIPSASLIPENDATVLFTTAGMQPLVPYLLGEPHPAGRRLVNAQKCVRTGDIEEVGDNRHLTFFEMLGNWSLGDYFKQEAIKWSWEFLTAPHWLGLDPHKIYVTVFAGNSDAPRDEDSIKIWSEIFVSAEIEPLVDAPLKKNGRIFSYSIDKNWWQPGLTGPQGPDTEIFYDTGREHNQKFGGACHPNCDCGRFIEIWNNVFMEYARDNDNEPLRELAQKNVDTGLGLERLTALLEEAETPFETSLFRPLLSKIEEITGHIYTENSDITRSMRIIADHVRAATFIIGDEHGVLPSNVDQGYVVRRLLRRAVRYGYALGKKTAFLSAVAEVVISQYHVQYPELHNNAAQICAAIKQEEEKFLQTITRGVREVEILRRRIIDFGAALDRLAGGAPDDTVARDTLRRSIEDGWVNHPELVREILEEKDAWAITQRVARLRDCVAVTGKYLFALYSTQGMPLELIKEFTCFDEDGNPIVSRCPVRFDEIGFAIEFKKHQETSRQGAEQKFTGGLADHSTAVTQLHTATHLLHQALRQVLGEHVLQKGSNITAERLRFDFSHPDKMTVEQIANVEQIVNEQITRALPISFVIQSVAAAKSAGAIGVFTDKYASLGDQVKVYTIGDKEHGVFSQEICGGPHVTNTGELGRFKILKEEAVAQGARRIKAALL